MRCGWRLIGRLFFLGGCKEGEVLVFLRVMMLLPSSEESNTCIGLFLKSENMCLVDLMAHEKALLCLVFPWDWMMVFGILR